MNDIEVVIDYLTMTTKIHSLGQVVGLLGLTGTNFESIKSFLGYQNCNYYEGVRIHWTSTAELYEVCIDLSGKGCRTVEEVNNREFDWIAFFKMFEADFKTGDCHISRIDIAADDFKGILKFETLTSYTQARKFVCRAKSEPWGTWGRKREIYFGSEKSERLLRFYDKALEQHRDDIQWIRAEMQFRNDCALSFILNLFQMPNIGKCYSGVLLDFLRFTTKTNTRSENAHRLATASFWKKFIGGIERIPQLYLQGHEYTLERCEKYIRTQSASSLKTYLMAQKGDLTGLGNILDGTKLNRKQEILINQLNVDRTMSDALVALATRNIDRLSYEQKQILKEHDVFR